MTLKEAILTNKAPGRKRRETKHLKRSLQGGKIIRGTTEVEEQFGPGLISEELGAIFIRGEDDLLQHFQKYRRGRRAVRGRQLFRPSSGNKRRTRLTWKQSDHLESPRASQETRTAAVLGVSLFPYLFITLLTHVNTRFNVV